MRKISGVSAAAGLLLLVAASIVLLWPLDANGVSGSAWSPKYSEYVGYASLNELPDNPTAADFRRAGIRLPRDVVAHRRHIAEVVSVLALVSLTVCAGTLLMTRRRTVEPLAG